VCIAHNFPGTRLRRRRYHDEDDGHDDDDGDGMAVVATTTLGPIKMQLDLAQQQSHRRRQRFIDSNLVAVNGLTFDSENALNAIKI